MYYLKSPHNLQYLLENYDTQEIKLKRNDRLIGLRAR